MIAFFIFNSILIIKIMFYQEVLFNDRKPQLSGNIYFYKIYSGMHVFDMCSGTISHMESHMQKYPTHKITWLEPESEYDPNTYYKRISNETTEYWKIKNKLR